MKLSSLLTIVAALVTAPALHAQFISWSAPSAITGPSDVLTNGTLIDALQTHYYAGGTGTAAVSETVLNPVTNINTTFGIYTNGDSDGIISLSNEGDYGSDGSYNQGSPYELAIDGTSFNQGSTATISIGDLVAGDEYQVQLWNANAGDSSRSTVFDLDGHDSAAFYGGYVVADFVAQGTSQDITYTAGPSGNTAEVNAVDIRLIPEPSTYAMLFAGVGALVLVFRLRRVA